MARGTSNTKATMVTGSPLPAEDVDDLTKIVASADDDVLYELMKLEPPAGASVTNVHVGFSPLRDGPLVIGDVAARNVTVHPVRVEKSSPDTASPRDVVSAVSIADTVKAAPTIAGAGLYGFDLLYAQITYVDITEKTKGTTVNFFWAAAAYVAFANPAPFGALPANTNASWNIPLAYVRNYDGQAAILSEDIIEVEPGLDTYVRDLQLRLTIQKTGVDARRAYSSADNSPKTLISGGTSKWVATAPAGTILSKTVSPITLGRRNVERVSREILIPYCRAGSAQGTAGTAAAKVISLVLDDTRDWRGGNFHVRAWSPNTNGVSYGEESAAAATAAGQPRRFPCMADTTAAAITASAMWECVGQSWVATTPTAGVPFNDARLWVALFGVDADIQGIGPRNGAGGGTWPIAGEGWGIFVDATSGVLKWFAYRGGAADGPPIYILLEGWFGDHYIL